MYDPDPPDPEAVKTTVCPTSDGFRFEDMDTPSAGSTVSENVDDKLVDPEDVAST